MTGWELHKGLTDSEGGLVEVWTRPGEVSVDTYEVDARHEHIFTPTQARALALALTGAAALADAEEG